MTEVPEHLLERSRARRAALGLLKDGEAAPAAAPAADAGATPAPAAAAPAAPAKPAAPVPAEEKPPPPPPPPYVEHAVNRRRVPWWAAIGLAFLPVWAIIYVGSLSGASTGEETALVRGGTIYSERCSSCHGATGGGGSGPALADGAVLETFPNMADQLLWVYYGSDQYQADFGSTYGATNKPIQGGMPSWGGTLTPEELTLVVRYEREVLGGAEVGEDADTDPLTEVDSEEELFIIGPDQEPIPATEYYFGGAAVDGIYTTDAANGEVFINGAEFSAPGEAE